MSTNVSQPPTSVARRPSGRFASTNITNELADAVNAFAVGNVASPTVGYQLRPYIIQSSELIAPNQWEYTCKATQPGGSNYIGRRNIEPTTYKARNAWEQLAGGVAGYVGDDIVGLHPIPDFAPIFAYMNTRDDGTVHLVFHERNQPICS